MRESRSHSERRALQALGLARRAGKALVGTRSVREGLTSGDVELVVLATDATENARKRLGVERTADVPVRTAADRTSLGQAVGRGPVAVLGVTDAGLAAKVARLLEDHPSPGEAPRAAAREAITSD